MSTVTLTFGQATFVLATFVHICNISAGFDQTLKEVPGTLFNGCQLSWSNLSRKHWSWQNLPISWKFQLLLTQFWHNFLDTIFRGCDFFNQIFFSTKFCLTQTFLDLQFFLVTKLEPKCVDPKFCWPKIVLDPNFFGPTFFGT